jgi:hypothetical protein
MSVHVGSDRSTTGGYDFRNLIPGLSGRYDDVGPVCPGLTVRELP